MPFRDITFIVETLPAAEAALDVSLSGIMATITDEADHEEEYKLTVMGEVSASEVGVEFPETFEVKVAAYDEQRRIVGTRFQMITGEGSIGLEVLQIEAYCKLPPVRFLVFPKRL